MLVFRRRGMTDNPMPHGLHQHIAAGKRFDQSVDMPAYGFEDLKVSFEIGDSSVQWCGDTVPQRQLCGGRGQDLGGQTMPQNATLSLQYDDPQCISFCQEGGVELREICKMGYLDLT